MRKILLLVILVFSCYTFGQKIKFKKNIASVDGKEYVKSEEDPASRNSYTISTLSGNELLYLRYSSYNDPAKVSKDNSTGRVGYFEVMSADLNTIFFEINLGGCMFCNLAYDTVKVLYTSKAITEDGKLDLQKIDMLSKKIGFEYSKRREELARSSQGNTIIIQQDNRPRNGVNISIGR